VPRSSYEEPPRVDARRPRRSQVDISSWELVAPGCPPAGTQGAQRPKCRPAIRATNGDVKIEQPLCSAEGPWAVEWEYAVLERLACAAYLVGRSEESSDVWARASQACARIGEVARAARCAFWLAFGPGPGGREVS